MKPDMWELYALITAVIAMSLGLVVGDWMKSNEIEKKCMYEHRVEFSGQLYSCQWLEGVTIDNQQYERKPHPLAKELK